MIVVPLKPKTRPKIAPRSRTKLAAVLFDRKGRAEATRQIVDLSRKFADRADRIEMWLEVVRRYRLRMLHEGTSRTDAARALDLLSESVRAESEARDKLARNAVGSLSSFWDFDVAPGGQVLEFKGPGDDRGE